MVNSPLIRPYLLGGGSFGGGTLDSHDTSSIPGLFYFSHEINKDPGTLNPSGFNGTLIFRRMYGLFTYMFGEKWPHSVGNGW